MIRIRITTEAMVDAFFTVSTLAKTCTAGVTEPYPIVDVYLDDGVITFILDDGKEGEIVEQLLEYQAVMPEFMLG